MPEDWLNVPENYMVTDGENVALFEKYEDGLYFGHVFFLSRGKEALRIGKEMLDFFFANTNCKIIRGLTPLQKVAARWFNRQLGFKGYGVIETMTGPCELFIMTRN